MHAHSVICWLLWKMPSRRMKRRNLSHPLSRIVRRASSLAIMWNELKCTTNTPQAR
ncbi:AGAP006123-PA [Anopheles gambiae str. PEST]|uniref:AGAP006123-PA n=1 Tax=Anopheles gambiae TaxID=7165 RepID=A0NEP1_ANOGA|nr:AGAP006123-PA [Anopheles gambiae str. PEST]